MTKKRFELIEFEDNVWAVYDTTEELIDENSSFSFVWKETVVDELNTLYEENQKLQKYINATFLTNSKENKKMGRFIIDDAGTLIDIYTRETYDIVEEVCPLLNQLHEENKELKQFRHEVFNKIGELYGNQKKI